MGAILRGLTLLLVLGAGAAWADIYLWTDHNGVKHITNTSPPPNATLLMREPEIPHDAAADRARRESERSARLESERIELAERQARLLERELELQREALELQRHAEEYRRRLQKTADKLEHESRPAVGYFIFGRYPYRPGPRHYYRKDGNIYYYRKGLHRKHALEKHPRPELRQGAELRGTDRPQGLHDRSRHGFRRLPAGAHRTPGQVYRYTRRY
jgi:hypothetical protein